MKCSLRSIRSSAECLCLGLTLAIAVSAGAVGLRADDDGAGHEALRSAIEDAVAARLGPSASARVTSLVDVRVIAIEYPLVAVPDATVRTGRAGRFAVIAVRPDGRRVRLGEATAIVAVTTDLVRTTRSVVRGMVLDTDDLEVARSEVVDVPLKSLPSMDELIGSRVTRDLPAGDRVTHADVSVEPTVRRGDVVRAAVRIRGVEIVATAVAMQNGARNEIIRVMNLESRQVFRGLVTAPKRVEVLDAR